VSVHNQCSNVFLLWSFPYISILIIVEFFHFYMYIGGLRQDSDFVASSPLVRHGAKVKNLRFLYDIFTESLSKFLQVSLVVRPSVCEGLIRVLVRG
jgi:hypothetical protein